MPTTRRSRMSVRTRSASVSGNVLGSTGCNEAEAASSNSSLCNCACSPGCARLPAAPVDPDDGAVVQQHLVERQRGDRARREADDEIAAAVAQRAQRGLGVRAADDVDDEIDERRRRARAARVFRSSVSYAIDATAPCCTASASLSADDAAAIGRSPRAAASRPRRDRFHRRRRARARAPRAGDRAPREREQHRLVGLLEGRGLAEGHRLGNRAQRTGGHRDALAEPADPDVGDDAARRPTNPTPPIRARRCRRRPRSRA